MIISAYKRQLTLRSAATIKQSDPTRMGSVLRQLVVLGRIIATHCPYFICLTNLRYGISVMTFIRMMMVENISVGAFRFSRRSGRFGYGLISASFVAFLREIDLGLLHVQ